MMITLSENVERSLHDYLRQARAYLRGSKSVDTDEVEQNITEHIENELEVAAEPVSCDVLDAVLKKLGKPQQWVPMEELPWWWRIIFRLRSGPEDWRFGIYIFGFAGGRNIGAVVWNYEHSFDSGRLSCITSGISRSG
jgi:hypothetical protein